MDNTIEKLQNKWNSDGVRFLVLLSLSIQISLMFLASLRKRSSNKVHALMIWMCYLSADVVPTLALGNMGKQIDPAEIGGNGDIPGDLTVLWAPFLLLHLGGPDNITSYAIDDNELWWRQPLGLVIQVVAAVYAFWQSPPNPVLWIPTSLVCIAGMIKFVERTLALCSGSRAIMTNQIMSEISLENDTKKGNVLSENIRNSMIESEWEIEDYLYDKVDVLPESTRQIEWGTEGIHNEVEWTERESMNICEGYFWFNIFKRLLVDVNFSSDQLMQSQDRFSECNPKDASDLIDIELSFLYDILHTKAIQKHSTLGRVLHCASLFSIIAALIVFHHLDMQKYASKDIRITYILFGAGLTLDVIATFLLVFSDWTVVSLRKKGWRKCIARAITTVVNCITFRKGKSRWSRNIGQYSLIGLCLRDRYTPRIWIMKQIIKIKHKLDNMRETYIPDALLEYMFYEAIRRAQNMHIYNVFLKARSYRGSKALEQHGQLQTLGWSMKKEFDECIILWHVATDICYYEETSGRPIGHDDMKREVSLIISNYMVYLLTQQQPMMQLGYGMKRFEATCDVLKKKFKGKQKLEGKEARKELMKEIEVVPPVLRQNVPVPDDGSQPTNQMGTSVLKKIWANLRPRGRRKREEDKRKRKDENEWGKLVLRDSCRLAKELQLLKPEIKWRLISETWMEMLGFAAIHCDSYQHAKSLSRGGELLTHLWLLMSQMGMVEEHKRQQFEYEFV